MSKFQLPAAFASVKGATVQQVQQFATLKAGRHMVSIFALLALADYQKVGKYNPSTKEYSVDEKEGFLANREWINDSAQLAVVFKNSNGIITEYYNLEGFFTPEDVADISILKSEAVMAANGWTPQFVNKITAKDLTACKSGDSTYACIITNKGAKRIVSPEKSLQCHSILSQVLVASGEEVGCDIFEAIESLGQSVCDGDDIIVDVEVVERKLSNEVKARMKKAMDSVYEVKRVRTYDESAMPSNLTPAKSGQAEMEARINELL